MEPPDHDRGDPRSRAFERHEIADTALVEPAVVVDDQDPAGGIGAGTLEGFEEHVDRADVVNGQRPARDRRALGHGVELRRRQPEGEPWRTTASAIGAVGRAGTFIGEEYRSRSRSRSSGTLVAAYLPS